MNAKVIIILGTALIFGVVIISMIISTQNSKMLETISSAKVNQAEEDQGLVKDVLGWLV